MANYIPNFEPGSRVTFKVGGAAVTSGQVVYLSAAARTVLFTAAAVASVVGVAAHDAAAGADLTVIRGGEHKLTASGAITHGTPVKSDAAGKVAAWVTGTDNPALIVGLALSTTTADGQSIDVAWRA